MTMTERLLPEGFKRKSDINLAIKYQLATDISIMGHFMHGDTIGHLGH